MPHCTKYCNLSTLNLVLDIEIKQLGKSYTERKSDIRRKPSEWKSSGNRVMQFACVYICHVINPAKYVSSPSF